MQYGDTIHTFVDRTAWTGTRMCKDDISRVASLITLAVDDFLPGFKKPLFNDPCVPAVWICNVSLCCRLLASLPETQLLFIDHVVGNQPDKAMEPVVDWCVAHVTSCVVTLVQVHPHPAVPPLLVGGR